MTRGVLILLGACVVGPVLDAGQRPQFHSGTDTVAVYATVTDKDGRLVPNLTRDDFVIKDNGKPQDLTLFSNDVAPITIVVMLDRSESVQRNFGLVRDAAERFVDDLLPNDRARIGTFSNRIDLEPEAFTSDHDALVRIVRGNMQDAGPTPLWQATSAAMDALTAEEGRRVVLIFTDGKNTEDRTAEHVSFGDVRHRAEAEEIMVYGIGLVDECGPQPSPIAAGTMGEALFQGRGGQRGRPGGRLPIPRIGGRSGRPRVLPPRRIPMPRMPPATRRGTGTPCSSSKPDPNLRELAAVSGGGYFELHATDNLSDTFARVADELHHQYLVAFRAATLDNKTHRLDVEVRRPGMIVRARKAYVAARGQ
jgi:VWFA-related protein